MKKNWSLLPAALLFLLASPLWAVGTGETSRAVYAASDGKGKISLMWFPPFGRSPAKGWRLEEGDGRVLVDLIVAGNPADLALLTAQDAEDIRRFPASLAKAKSQQERQNTFGVFAARALTSWSYARALGWAWTLDGIGAGARVYRVVGLDAAGRPDGTVLTGTPVDAMKATPLPPAPLGLRAEARAGGVALFWSPALEARTLLVAAYRIERDDGDHTSVPVTDRPLLLGVRWDDKTPTWLDRTVPVEEQVTYRVYSLDPFGRASLPATVALFVADVAALFPPEAVTAKGVAGKVELGWRWRENPHTAGFVVERALLPDGPFEVLTGAGLARDARTFTDADVRGGTTYFYRVRVVGPRGDVGHPSELAMAQPQNPSRPPRPSGVSTDVGRSRIRLTWEPVSFPVAGYFVERQAESEASWVRLNSSVTSEAMYDDYIGLGTTGKFRYRIVAVAFDNQESEGSQVVAVELLDTTPPAPPHVVMSDGNDGKVALTFTPALPAERTAQVLVVRAGSAEDPGVVIGDPLPGTTRTLEDVNVKAGESYWYRLIAVDRAGNRSEPSLPVVVRVGAPAIPAAPKPVVELVTEPFPHVKISVTPPGEGLQTVVQRRLESETTWFWIAGPMREHEALDAKPPARGKALYRIVYQAANGAQGEPSPPAELVRK